MTVKLFFTYFFTNIEFEKYVDGTTAEDSSQKDEDCSASKKIQLSNFPFKHCVVNDFITGDEFLADLGNELSDLNYTHQNSDLFQFHQSDAFDGIDLPHVAAVKKLLYKDMHQWLKQVTKEPLYEYTGLSSLVFKSTSYSD
jgi:hypothetical protein